MIRKTLIASFLASSSLMLAVATPGFASTNDRAKEAIAAAEAKVNTAQSIGTGVEVPGTTAAARAALATAKEDFASGHKEAAIDDAIHASELADTAIGESQRHKEAAVAAAHESAQASVAEAHEAAQASVAAAQDQAASAEQQAAHAQAQAADANARADAAEQSAASSAVEASAARDAAAATAAQAQPTQVETTVTTQHQGPVHRSTKAVQRTTHVAAAPAASSTDQVTTTTTVSPH